METRALAIAFFYAIGTAVGGITGPFLFGKMIESGEESQVAIAFYIGAAIMAIGGIVELFLGIRAEQESLEDIAKPLTAEEAEERARARARATARARSAAVRQRDARDEAAARARRRRYRLGPGQTSSSPGMFVSAPTRVEFEREVSAIERVLAGREPAERRELAQRVGARLWGPGRFSAALHEAVESGRVRRVSRNRFARARRPPASVARDRHRGDSLAAAHEAHPLAGRELHVHRDRLHGRLRETLAHLVAERRELRRFAGDRGVDVGGRTPRLAASREQLAAARSSPRRASARRCPGSAGRCRPCRPRRAARRSPRG